MNTQAFVGAKRLLGKCHEHLARMHRVGDPEETAGYYSDFLQDSNRFFNKMKGAVAGTRLQAWFSEIEEERKKDELHCYARQARNTDGHTATPLGHAQGERLEIKVETGGTLSEFLYEPAKGFQFGKNDRGVSGRLLGPSVQPADIVNRSQLYYRPSRHLGAEVHVSTVNELAQLVLEYMDRVMADASKKWLSRAV